MESYYELKEMLCKELEDLVQKGELSAGSLDAVDKITHSIKSLMTIMMMDEEQGQSSNDGSYGSYGSYARGGRGGNRGGRGGNSGRRYSREEGRSYMSREVERLMDESSNDRERDVLQRAYSQLQSMR